MTDHTKTTTPEGRSFERPVNPWERCKEHGPAQQNVWACPTCLAELREENKRLRERDASWYGFAAAIGENLKCLPSASPTGNGHIVRKLHDLTKRLNTEAQRAAAGGPTGAQS